MGLHAPPVGRNSFLAQSGSFGDTISACSPALAMARNRHRKAFALSQDS